MHTFLKLLPPAEARERWLTALPQRTPTTEQAALQDALDRVLAEDVYAPHPMPEFTRSTVDGFAVRAADTYGASDGLPMYLTLVGEVTMGAVPQFAIQKTQAAVIHTGGMLPEGADAVVMLEYTQMANPAEVEIQRAVAVGENTILRGEDVQQGQVVIPAGRRLRVAELGGLAGIGVIQVPVRRKPRIGILTSGDEVIPPEESPSLGQVRDINSTTLTMLAQRAGGEPVFYGIIPDSLEALQVAAHKAHTECDAVVVAAGSSVSARDITAQVIAGLGQPGVLVHGVSIRPGKPTILAVCDEKPVIGLPGNPVSAYVIAGLFMVPMIYRLLEMEQTAGEASLKAVIQSNVPSQAGREDYIPVRLVQRGATLVAEPVYFKSNLIFNLVQAQGLIHIEADANGVEAGQVVEVYPL